MEKRRILALAAAVAAALALAGAAAAHVEPSPSSAQAGSTIRLTLTVESENPRSPTVKVAVRVPAEVVRLTVPAKAGWRAGIVRERLAKPAQVGGTTITSRIAVITWKATGGGIAPNGREPFAVVVTVPSRPGRLVWPTVNTFRDGTASYWIGPADADHPAPVLKVTAR